MLVVSVPGVATRPGAGLGDRVTARAADDRADAAIVDGIPVSDLRVIDRIPVGVGVRPVGAVAVVLVLRVIVVGVLSENDVVSGVDRVGAELEDVDVADLAPERVVGVIEHTADREGIDTAVARAVAVSEGGTARVRVPVAVDGHVVERIPCSRTSIARDRVATKLVARGDVEVVVAAIALEIEAEGIGRRLDDRVVAVRPMDVGQTRRLCVGRQRDAGGSAVEGEIQLVEVRLVGEPCADKRVVDRERRGLVEVDAVPVAGTADDRGGGELRGRGELEGVVGTGIRTDEGQVVRLSGRLADEVVAGAADHRRDAGVLGIGIERRAVEDRVGEVEDIHLAHVGEARVVQRRRDRVDHEVADAEGGQVGVDHDLIDRSVDREGVVGPLSGERRGIEGLDPDHLAVAVSRDPDLLVDVRVGVVGADCVAEEAVEASRDEAEGSAAAERDRVGSGCGTDAVEGIGGRIGEAQSAMVSGRDRDVGE